MSLKNYDNRMILGLISSIKKDQLAHAYIIEGGNKKERLKLANDFCKAVFCSESRGTGCDNCITCKKIDHGNHEDVFFLEQSNKTGYSVDDIRELSQKLNMKSTSGYKSVAIIEDAEKINEVGQNKMLKLLEEPGPGSLILLLTDNIENMLKTIISRCFLIRLKDDNDGTNRQREKALEIYNLINGKEYFKDYREYLNRYIKTDEDVAALLNELEIYYGELLVNNYENEKMVNKYSDSISNIEKTRMDILNGMNKKNALKRMYIELGGK